MTDSHPSARDELVAAYLDGEATAEERAQVEADPQLLERVQTFRRVAEMVETPVTPPPLELRRRHIATALDASTTAENVTAMASRRWRWGRASWHWDAAKVASIAAVVVALLAVPIILFGNGGDDADVVATSADDTAADDGPVEGLDADEARAPAAEPEEQELAATAAEDAAEGGEADLADTAGADAADDGAADDAAADDSPGALEPEAFALNRLSVFSEAVPLDLDVVADADALADEVRATLAEIARDRRTFESATDGELSVLFCQGDWTDLTTERVDPAEVRIVGTALLDREQVEYIAADTDEGVVLIALAVFGCDVVIDEVIDR